MHSPLPWWNGLNEDDHMIYTGDCDVVANTLRDDGDAITEAANAEFIVRACNCHEELLAACQLMLPLLENAEKCERSADDGYGERLRNLRRDLQTVRTAITALR